MAVYLDILAPQMETDTSAYTLARWLKGVGHPVFQNEPIAELMGPQSRAYVHAPADGMLSEIHAQPGQNILSGVVLGRMSAISKEALDWENFDEVTAMVETFADEAKDCNQIKDANEALGQLLGITDNPIYRNLSIQEQNVFLQSVVDESKARKMNPAMVTQRLLEGLHLRMPANAPRAPSFGLGMQGPAGPGMGGGMGGGYMPQPQQQAIPQPHAYPSYPAYPAYPPQGGAMPPYPQQPPAGYWPPPPGYPPHGVDPQTGQPMPPPVVPPQQVPHTTPQIDHEHDDDENKK